MKLTHLDENGDARMVDVGEKNLTHRLARAEAVVTMQPETLRLIQSGGSKKGDVLACARIAGIMAAKQTHILIPMCHQVPIDRVSVSFAVLSEGEIRIEAEAACTYRTGIEMEALTAASVAALTIYDMCKAADRSMQIGGIRLLHKSGGKSGTYEAEDRPAR